ncbi:Hsp70 family protein [Phytohabitans houttuyneae]|uniref:Hsp70 family protein n=1 Tax=Phytohabitans houttuyneae TaxID=1076126 RepID=UPI001C49A25A|nr:Hsp70 family protein [Phytohabitans houttuyneae]
MAWPNGGWLPLHPDGVPWLSSAVHVSADGTISTGEQAWQAAAITPDGFEPCPLRLVGQEHALLAGRQVPVVDLVAATLARMAGEAARIAGVAVQQSRLAVPASWGPVRCTWLRRAARRAGLGEVSLVAAPVAVAEHLLASGHSFPVGSYLAVCDIGGGAEVTVLRRGSAGFEVLSTLTDQDAGGLQIDELLAASLDGRPGGTDAGVAAGVRWQLLAAARAAKATVSTQAAVTVQRPAPYPPMVVTAGQVETLAGPVLQRAGRLVLDAVAAAELAVDQVSVVLAGGGAAMPAAARAVGEVVGREPLVTGEPGVAAVRGAAAAVGPAAVGPDQAMPDIGPPVPPFRRFVALAVPAAASLALFVDFAAIKARAGGRDNEVYRYRDYSPGVGGFGPGDFHYKINWGELAIAGSLAVVACLCAAALLASVLPVNAGMRTPSGSDGVQMGGGLLASLVIGLAGAGLYAVGAAGYIAAPAAPFLKWAIVPLLPLAVVVAVAAIAVARWGRRPAVGWHVWLRFPISSVIAATAGMLLVHYTFWHWTDTPLIETAARFGGLLIGVGAALALAQPLPYRVVVAAPLGAATALLTSPDSTGVLGVIYVLAVTVWWAQRLWQLAYRPPAAWQPPR